MAPAWTGSIGSSSMTDFRESEDPGPPTLESENATVLLLRISWILSSTLILTCLRELGELLVEETDEYAAGVCAIDAVCGEEPTPAPAGDEDAIGADRETKGVEDDDDDDDDGPEEGAPPIGGWSSDHVAPPIIAWILCTAR